MIGRSLVATARLRASWVVALVVLANSVAHGQTQPSDLVAPSLVYLKVSYTPTKGPSSGVPMTDQSTGFMVSDDGFILTSYHLLDNVSEYKGENVEVKAAVGDPEAPLVTAAIVNGLPPLDVLLLKIRAMHPLPFLKLGRAGELNTGDHVYTSGFHGTNPFNNEGTVSNKFGPLGIGYLWTLNISVASGESGSPVYKADGKVVGLLKGDDKTAPGIGYMVPIEFADALIVHLRFRELEQLLMAHTKEIGSWKEEDEPIAPRLAKVEAGMHDISSNFTWSGKEAGDRKIILEYHKLVSGAPKIEKVLLTVTPLITEERTTVTNRDRPFFSEDDSEKARLVTQASDRSGTVIIEDMAKYVDGRVATTQGIRIQRIEVSIVAILDDRTKTKLEPVTLPIDIAWKPK